MDTVFHTLLVIFFVAVIGMRLYYHRLARTWERSNRAPEGRVVVYTRLFAGIPLILVTFAYLFRPRVLAWASFSLPVEARWLGAALCAASVPALWWVQQHLGRNFSGELRLRSDHTLVTTGPYRYVRHPMYTVFLTLLTGFLLLSANWFIGGGSLAVVIVILIFRTGREEDMLLEAFGEQYQAYLNRTGRFLPRLRNSASPRPVS